MAVTLQFSENKTKLIARLVLRQKGKIYWPIFQLAELVFFRASTPFCRSTSLAINLVLSTLNVTSGTSISFTRDPATDKSSSCVRGTRTPPNHVQPGNFEISCEVCKKSTPLGFLRGTRPGNWYSWPRFRVSRLGRKLVRTRR